MGKTVCAEPDGDEKKMPPKKMMKGKNPFGNKGFGKK